MMKRVLSLIAALLILCTLLLGADAHDYVQMDREGSVTLELKYDDEPLIGGKFSCIKVADVVEEDGNYYFRTLVENEIYREGMPTLAHVQELVKNNPEAFNSGKITCSNETGTVTFEGCLPGLYLITQDTKIQGYGLMNAFLVSVPYMDDGVYVYDITAQTKSALEQDEIETEPEEEDKDDKLPQTGQLNWPVPAMAACGLAVFAFGWYLRFGKKKETYEE